MDRPDDNDLVRTQFDAQAERFANWAAGLNQQYAQGYFDFCGLSAHDTMLDVACGPGDFALFCAARVARVTGVDISEKELAIACERTRALSLDNVEFLREDVERLPFEVSSFSAVVCRSALHHMPRRTAVFEEMVRCCRPGGKLSVLDIAAYDDPFANAFFEELERRVDQSHCATLTQKAMFDLFRHAEILIVRTFAVEVPLNMREYREHAAHSEADAAAIDDILRRGQGDPRVTPHLLVESGELFFKRNVLLVLGQKPV